jgi:hypothetical protein
MSRSESVITRNQALGILLSGVLGGWGLRDLFSTERWWHQGWSLLQVPAILLVVSIVILVLRHKKHQSV